MRDAAGGEATVFVGRLHLDWGSFGVDSNVSIGSMRQLAVGR